MFIVEKGAISSKIGVPRQIVVATTNGTWSAPQGNGCQQKWGQLSHRTTETPFMKLRVSPVETGESHANWGSYPAD